MEANLGGVNLFFLFICFMLFTFLLSKLRTGNFINIITPFMFIWVLMLFFSHFMAGNLYQVSDKTYNAIYLFVSLVVFWFLMFSKKINSLKNISQIQNYFGSKKSKVGNRLLIIIQIAVLLILLLYLIKYNNIKNSISIDQLRIVRYYVGPFFSTSFELLFYNYVISTFVELMGLIAIVKVIMNYEVDIRTILSLSSLIIFSLIGLGRFGLFNVIYFVIATFLFLKISFYKNQLNKKMCKNVIFMLGIIGTMITLMVLIGSTRQGKQLSNISDFFLMLSESFYQAIIYFIGPFRSLDYFFHYSSNYVEGWLYGKAFFSGIDEFFSFLFSSIGIHWTSGNSVISLLTSEPIDIGPKFTFNAFYTAVLNAYLDGGYYGIAILGSLLGVLTSFIWNFHLRKRNFYSFLLMIYFSLILISTEYRFEFQQFKSYVIVLLLIILSNKESTKSTL